MKTIKERNQPVSSNVRKIMEINSLSLEELSFISGIDPLRLEKMLNDKMIIDAEYIVLLAKALDTDPNTLFKKTD